MDVIELKQLKFFKNRLIYFSELLEEIEYISDHLYNVALIPA
jgi:hypothetical protein